MVIYRKELVAEVIKKLGFSEETVKNNFSERFLIQKYIYLLQEWKGYHWNYTYNVYHSGPYSPELTRDVYSAINENLVSDANEIEDERFLSALEEVKKLAENDNELLEALTTLHYIADSLKWTTDNINELEINVKKRFGSVKPYIDKNIMNRAWEKAIDNSLIS